MAGSVAHHPVGRRRRRAASVVALLVASALALPAPVGAASAAGAAAGPVQGPTTPAVATPLLSVRRIPGWLAATVATQRIATGLSAIVTPAALGPATGHACLVVEQGGRSLFDVSPDQPLIPASNMKVLTAVAALDELGANYRYTTVVRADSAAVAGVVTGNLYVVGSGDPVLRTPQFELTRRHVVPPTTSLPALAAQVRAAGVTEITGSVIGDESRYDTQRAVPTWKPAYTEQGDAGPLSALDVDDGFQATPRGFAAAAQPATAAAQTFSSLLAADGIKVDGPAAVGTTPPAAVAITSIESAPLSQILGAVLAPSDDTGAELILKELGRVVKGAGTTTAGSSALLADLTAAGLPVSGLTAVDGSGLDRGDRVTCRLLAAVLTRAGASAALASALPVAGRSGTLATRMGGVATAGRVLAKTGTLADVSALSGFVLPSATAPAPTLQLRTPVVFSLIMDGVAVTTGVTIGDNVATALAAYPVVPALSVLGPRQ